MQSFDPRTAFAAQYLSDVQGVLGSIPLHDLASAMRILEEVRESDHQVFLAGNGGSAATASHMAADLRKCLGPRGKGIRAIALVDHVPHLTAIANDEGYAEVFVRQLWTLAHPGDLLIVLSVSGNSENLIRALEAVKALSLHSIALLGRDGGALRSLVDVPVIVPSEDYGSVEDCHLIFNHLIASYLCEVKQERTPVINLYGRRT